MIDTDYTDVTEMAGEEISVEQLHRLADRYYWAGTFTDGKDVIEIACGTGPGLGYLKRRAKSLRAGDVSQAMVDRVRHHYGDRVDVRRFHAEEMPFPDNSADVILLLEALYYLRSAERFAAECRRILRPGGVVLISNANKDIFDFNPSPYSHAYHGVVELARLFGTRGFRTEFWGSTPLAEISFKQKLLRPVKKIAVSLNLIPGSMSGKRLLKRLVFGRPVPMPAEITGDTAPTVVPPTALSAAEPSRDFKVIYCAAWTAKDTSDDEE